MSSYAGFLLDAFPSLSALQTIHSFFKESQNSGENAIIKKKKKALLSFKIPVKMLDMTLKAFCLNS